MRILRPSYLIKDFAFEWQNPNDNKVVRNWTTFADMFLSIPMAHQMSTLFTILDGTKNKQMLKVYASLIRYMQQKQF